MPELQLIWEAVVSILLIAGGAFAFIGALGLARFKDFFMRLHGPAKSSTLGVGCILAASMLYFGFKEETFGAQETLITLFLVITAPVSAHLLAMSGLHHRLPRHKRTQGDPFEAKPEKHQGQ